MRRHRFFPFALLLFTLVTFCAPMQAQDPVPACTLEYGSDQFRLSEDHREQLRDIRAEFEKTDGVKLRISGHTDAEGSASYNSQLSRDRAEAVRAYFVEEGSPEELIMIDYHGEKRLLTREAIQGGHRKNRRVEVELIPFDPSAERVFDRWEKEPQTFTVEMSTTSEIRGKKGTRVHIPKRGLVKKDGSEAQGKVRIELKEYYKGSSIIKADLHTVSNGKPLRTGGMIHIQAIDEDGDTLQPRDRIGVDFSSENAERAGMGVFNGDDTDEGLEWEEGSSAYSTMGSSSFNIRVKSSLSRNPYKEGSGQEIKDTTINVNNGDLSNVDLSNIELSGEILLRNNIPVDSLLDSLIEDYFQGSHKLFNVPKNVYRDRTEKLGLKTPSDTGSVYYQNHKFMERKGREHALYWWKVRESDSVLTEKDLKRSDSLKEEIVAYRQEEKTDKRFQSMMSSSVMNIWMRGAHLRNWRSIPISRKGSVIKWSSWMIGRS